jgi:hypothetical protein
MAVLDQACDSISMMGGLAVGLPVSAWVFPDGSPEWAVLSGDSHLVGAGPGRQRTGRGLGRGRAVPDDENAFSPADGMV